jgi:hypothetical protein
MNYYGYTILSKNVSLKDLYAFLREALKRVDEETPFRGPEKWGALLQILQQRCK